MPIFVGSGSSSFISKHTVGIAITDTTGRNAGIGTVNGALIYNTTSTQIEVFYEGNWIGGLTAP